jgi:hypothetical protein
MPTRTFSATSLAPDEPERLTVEFVVSSTFSALTLELPEALTVCSLATPISVKFEEPLSPETMLFATTSRFARLAPESPI